MDVVETAIGRHSSDLTTRSMCLISLLKLSSRFPSCSKYGAITSVQIIKLLLHRDHLHISIGLQT